MPGLFVMDRFLLHKNDHEELLLLDIRSAY